MNAAALIEQKIEVEQERRAEAISELSRTKEARNALRDSQERIADLLNEQRRIEREEAAAIAEAEAEYEAARDEALAVLSPFLDSFERAQQAHARLRSLIKDRAVPTVVISREDLLRYKAVTARGLAF